MNISTHLPTLSLTLKKEWYDMIESGEKQEEYREIKDYWICRLCATPLANFHEFFPDVDFAVFDFVTFRNGYSKTARKMTFVLTKIEIGKGNPKWGAPEEDVFIIKLGQRI